MYTKILQPWVPTPLRVNRRNGIKPTQIGRMYLGTESALDGAKPTATYILDMLTQRYSGRFGEDCFEIATLST